MKNGKFPLIVPISFQTGDCNMKKLKPNEVPFGGRQ